MGNLLLCDYSAITNTLQGVFVFEELLESAFTQQNKSRSLFRVRDTAAGFSTSFAQFYSFHLLLLHKRGERKKAGSREGFLVLVSQEGWGFQPAEE